MNDEVNSKSQMKRIAAQTEAKECDHEAAMSIAIAQAAIPGTTLAVAYLDLTRKLEAEQERHREIHYEWEMACERNRDITQRHAKLLELVKISLDAPGWIFDSDDYVAAFEAKKADADLRAFIEEEKKRVTV